MGSTGTAPPVHRSRASAAWWTNIPSPPTVTAPRAFAAAKADGHKSVLLRVKSGDSVRFLALPVQAAS